MRDDGSRYLLGHARDLYIAHCRITMADPDGVAIFEVIDNETDEVIPPILMAMAGSHVRNRDRWKREPEVKTDWAKEGF